MSQVNPIVLKQAMAALANGGKTDQNCAQIFANVSERLCSYETYDIYKQAFLTQKNTIKAKLATNAVVKACPDVLAFMAEQAEILLTAENKIISLNVLHSTSAVLYIAKHIIDSYNAYKEIYATLDYEDLIVITRQLLENNDVADWVLFKLDGGIEHILIDEAQDTSPNQWAIIRALTEEFFAGLGSREDEKPRTVFVVGDRKQSIYSFQGADPKEFDKFSWMYLSVLQKQLWTASIHYLKMHTLKRVLFRQKNTLTTDRFVWVMAEKSRLCLCSTLIKTNKLKTINGICR